MTTMHKVSVPAELYKHGKPIGCECGNNVFEERIQVMRISKLVPENKTRQDLFFEQTIKQCTVCDHILTPKDYMGG